MNNNNNTNFKIQIITNRQIWKPIKILTINLLIIMITKQHKNILAEFVKEEIIICPKTSYALTRSACIKDFFAINVLWTFLIVIWASR